MDFSTVCRTCLCTSNLNLIFLNPGDDIRYSSALLLTTGIKIEINDGLPQKMCTECINCVNSSLKFRKQCKNAEENLIKLKASLDTLTNNHFIKGEKVNDLETEVQKIELEIELDDEIKQEKCLKNSYYTDDEEKPLKCLIEDTSEDNNTDLIEETLIENLNNIPKLSNNGTELPYQEVFCTTSKTKRVMCKLCQKNLSIRSIDTHMARSHPGADERKVKCDLCDNYVLKEKLKRHKALMHGTEQFQCGYCKSDYGSRELLVEHVSTCTAKKQKRKISEASRQLSECDICHKRMQKASLKMHKAIKHAGLGPVCEHCGKRFGNKFRLNEHYRAKHGYEKFKCSYCDFQSAGVMAMRNHERRHRGEKPYVCETCGAKFHAAYLLAQHKQSHKTEKLLKCDLCPASFKAKNSLHKHKLTCHSRSLYKCCMCARAYSCRHYAVKHLRHVHRYRGPVPELQRLPQDSNA